ncbi:hypothetical protein [Microbacterium rhizomatis]|uniref:DUF2076 domain-containing protein n=1 Tax=Microbacterium rhizomatis TaxID=1631477 RepID=A0A5J5J614_9MICO|nr:hypothetical protein [Microbacterium rhizomatis]KAA9110869.1 hypothetical protein F6B43_04335 [Microbacterium rhizomatis]
MGFWDRLMGNDDAARQAPTRATGYDRPAQAANQPPRSEDEIAIERYRYLLRTAPPETIEQVHAEAFAKLTEPQRQQVLADLSAGLSAAERPASTDPQSMARAATRAESMNPGFMERTLGSGGGRQGPGFGAMVGSSILGTVAGYVIGSALVSAFMEPAFAYDEGYGDGSADASATDAGSADAGGADWGGGDFGGGDFGGFDGF